MFTRVFSEIAMKESIDVLEWNETIGSVRACMRVVLRGGRLSLVVDIDKCSGGDDILRVILTKYPDACVERSEALVVETSDSDEQQTSSGRVFSESATSGKGPIDILEWSEVIGSDRLPAFMRVMIKGGRLLVVIDIDKCAVPGGDTNDILRIILAKYPNACVEQREGLEAVGKALVNPRLVEAVKSIKAPDVNIVVYTQKSNTLAVMRSEHVEIPRIAPGTMYLEGDALSRGPDYLCLQCRPTAAQARSYKELLRIGIVTHGIAAALGSKVSPAVYVTETKKDLRVIARHLGVDGEKCFLFDDSAEKHIQLLRDDAAFARAHMIPVDVYDFTTMDKAHAERLRCLLEHHFPMKGLKETNPKEYSEIIHDPRWPKENRCITPDEDWIVHYPDGKPVGPWNTEPVVGACAGTKRRLSY